MPVSLFTFRERRVGEGRDMEIAAVGKVIVSAKVENLFDI
jgi:hypothetical protein